jgi:hypothetical protein
MFRTFTERTFEPDSQIEQNRNAVLEAETLVFLGFAFHMLNLGLLFGSPQECAVSYSKQAFGTALGLSESVKDSIALKLSSLGLFHSNRIILRRDLSAAQLLPEKSRTLRVPGAA